ncbi:glyoxylate reductase/hydroxypyruvate reductase-like [Amphibalanus amphitrite]|uniref:glyoxylate reductase/hydroxypyruvate reductase-like n=1 Tax=Amphibalanus amphitrite TaxID=1232801 RepID=UPI001C92310A|nr:glyoxylate reductase/hydroxypyruvate reductase-like [Amphibalanus amphitrite]
MTRPSVLVTRPDIPPEGLALLRDRCDVTVWDKPEPVERSFLLENIKGKDALFCMVTEKIDRELLDAAGPSLKVIGTMSVGHDHIDMAEVKARGIKVGFTPDVLTDATAELVMALLLMTGRRLVEARQQIYNGGWAGCAWSPLWMCGQGLAGSTAGIVGLGRIGQGVAARLRPFNVSTILYTGRTERPEAAALGAQFVPFDELLARSDFVIVTCALNDDTRGLFNEAAFGKMKSNAVLINASRGGTVDQEALAAALRSGRIQAAGLDVMTPEPLPPTHPLANMTNCTLTPHVGSATVKSRTDMATLTARNILTGLDGAQMPARLC